jgi:transcriptional regulator with XRE-family HTH domain
VIHVIGEKIRQLRVENGMTQKELAKKVGVSASAIGMYEQGRRIPDSTVLTRLARILKCSTDELLGAQSSSDIGDVIDSFARTLERQQGLMFNGAPMSRSDREKIANAIRIAAALSSPKE